ncbi:MAG: formate dehydrogenase accessory sulfurtransferase FdhD [Deltaproteobacteria bacterium]|nr:formate dehydrogenase accessory sulfurtransferase FdhD [Deltaproteobacteria bacterium]
MRPKDLEQLTGKGRNTETYRVVRCKKGVCRSGFHELIGEEPLLIRIDENPYAVVMRTPGEEIFHAAGFCLGEGLADSPDDFLTIGFCKDLDPNVIEIKLKPERREKIKDIIERRSFVSQTSCGLCGKELVKDLFQVLTPAENGFRVDVNRLFDCIGRLSENQKYYQRTRGSHAAIIFNRQLEMISFAEDVGRHNALDKAIGKVFLSGKLPEAVILILSSRISYELVQKAARARLPIMISMSRPTALAAEMGQALNMTLACADKESELILVCGESRIVF